MLCRSNPTALYNIHEIQRAIGDTAKHLMFLHAMTGCDTVSSIYRQGKRKAFNTASYWLETTNRVYYMLTVPAESDAVVNTPLFSAIKLKLWRRYIV